MDEQVPKRRTRGLVRILLVACLLFVAGVLLQSYQRERILRAKSSLESYNNLKNLALAIHDASSFNQDVLPHPSSHTPPLSWRVDVLKYLDQSALGRQYQTTAAWNDPVNAEVSRTSLRFFQSPMGDRHRFWKYVRTHPDGWPRSDYGMVSGPGTVNPDDHQVSLDEIAQGDGLSQTFLLVECSGLQLAWAEPRDPRVDRDLIRIDLLKRVDQKSDALISTFNNAPVVAFCDGSARKLSTRTDPAVLKALCMIDGKESVNEDDYQVSRW